MNRSTLPVCLLAICCILVFPSVTANNASDGDFWQTRAAFPQAVSGIKAVTVNDTIYVFSSHFTYMYDPIADNWVTKQAMPTPRNDYAIATVENKIYIIGGQGPTAPSSVNEVYDTITDTWTTKQPLYPARVQMEANVVDGKIYVIGGVGPARSDGQGFESLNEVYDPATDEWTSKTPPVDFMSSYLSCVIDKKIYIISHEFNVDIYNTETDNWSKGSDIPEFYVGRGIAATTGEYAPKRIYVLGGYESTGFGEATVNNLNYVYDPTADSWSTAANMLTARSSFAVAVVKDKIYVIGGAVGWYDRTNAVEVYTPQGYQDNSPSSSPSNSEDYPPTLTETTYIIIGAAVAAAVITVAGLAVYHYKHAPSKTANPP